jgi:hypothetical protein
MKPSYHELLKENARLNEENAELDSGIGLYKEQNARLESENKVLKQNIEQAKKALDLGMEPSKKESEDRRVFD